MEFGWISLIGIGIVILIMIPNIIYAAKKKKEETKDRNRVPRILSVCEQIGRYACIVLMWLPLLVWKFGFTSTEEMLIYLIANGVLLLLYYLFWVTYSGKKTLAKAMALAIIPSVIFLLSGILLRHWLLVAAAIIFAASHCGVTCITHKK